MQKTTYIKDLKEGNRFADVFLVKSIKTGETRAGKPYFVLTLTDKSGEISGPVWNKVEQLKQLCIVGEVVEVSGIVQSYRDQPQLKIDSIMPVDRTTIHLEDFVQAAPGNRNTMKHQVQALVKSVQDKYLRTLLIYFFRESEWWTLFQEAPAAKGIHHAYVGGLLEHSLSVATIADFMSRHYRGVNRSLLIAGALLHDIGKLQELKSSAGLVDYTVGGRLVGHIVMGAQIVSKAAEEIKDFPLDLLEQLQHLIISHHGRREFGSPTLPMTVEALILSFIDDLDSKVNVTEQLRRNMGSSELGWTDYQRSLERYLYLGGFEEPESDEKIEVTEQVKRQQTLF